MKPSAPQRGQGFLVSVVVVVVGVVGLRGFILVDAGLVCLVLDEGERLFGVRLLWVRLLRERLFWRVGVLSRVSRLDMSILKAEVERGLFLGRVIWALG
jgi:hypothetical protein